MKGKASSEKSITVMSQVQGRPKDVKPPHPQRTQYNDRHGALFGLEYQEKNLGPLEKDSRST